MLVYGVSTAGTDGWSSPVTLGLLSAAVVGLVAFVVIELRSSHPLFPMRVVLDRNRGGSVLTSLLVGCAMLGTFLFLTYFFQGTLHYSVVKTGFAFLPFSFGIMSGATISSRLLPRVGPRTLMTAGLTVAAVGLALFSRAHVDSSYLALVMPAELIVSLGMGNCGCDERSSMVTKATRPTTAADSNPRVTGERQPSVPAVENP